MFPVRSYLRFFFFFNDTATTEIYTLSLHDALPICRSWRRRCRAGGPLQPRPLPWRSEEHTSELQSPCNLVCRLLLEKKKKPPLIIFNTITIGGPCKTLLLELVAETDTSTGMTTCTA